MSSPFNQLEAISASHILSFIFNQTGDSGVKKTAKQLMDGTIQQAEASRCQGKKDPSMYTQEIPKAIKTAGRDLSKPLIFGSVHSEI